MTVKFVDKSEVDIYCPECQQAGRGAVKLIVRTVHDSDRQFLGCPMWPDCNHTRGIPESMKMKAQGQPELL